MDTTIDALRNLYVARGGTAADVAELVIIPDLINAIAALVSAQEPELPAVDASDNGSVLKVIDGAWGVGTDETT